MVLSSQKRLELGKRNMRQQLGRSRQSKLGRYMLNSMELRKLVELKREELLWQLMDRHSWILLEQRVRYGLQRLEFQKK